MVDACHPAPTAVVTIAVTLLAAAAGRDRPGLALMALATLTGQLSIGWCNDWFDAAKDSAANRQDKLVMSGATNLARTESDFSGSIFPVLEAIEEQVTLIKLFGEMEIDPDGVSVSIGRENQDFGPGGQLSETSVLASGYTASGGSVARLGVLGPTRMDYSNNMAAVRAVARYLTRLLGEEQ